MFVRVKKT